MGKSSLIKNYVQINRKKAGLSLDKLSVKTGIDTSYISKIENYVRLNIGLETAWKISLGLDCSIEDLFSPFPQLEDEKVIEGYYKLLAENKNYRIMHVDKKSEYEDIQKRQVELEKFFKKYLPYIKNELKSKGHEVRSAKFHKKVAFKDYQNFEIIIELNKNEENCKGNLIIIISKHRLDQYNDMFVGPTSIGIKAGIVFGAIADEVTHFENNIEDYKKNYERYLDEVSKKNKPFVSCTEYYRLARRRLKELKYIFEKGNAVNFKITKENNIFSDAISFKQSMASNNYSPTFVFLETLSYVSSENATWLDNLIKVLDKYACFLEMAFNGYFSR